VLLAGIPSIIYGFFGMIVLSPALKKTFGAESGNGLLASALILGLMILPTVASLAKNAFESVPASYGEGSLALGATKAQTVFKIEMAFHGIAAFSDEPSVEKGTDDGSELHALKMP